ncbi:DUF3267 domain-containing protein [Bacillus sp. AGMB 02131]|uniref:DUF3267 domain-containing protein n=1 Tax=Peribacillus faecalis TaxID=2772559 RepID=A0A927HBY4_9BACI|nr:DUF3267 domain-containing protein [Peribacillus faecalis]MBD3110255.1 DUF3267 domain-containing protein [Peribacillus faecalis]
MHCWKSINKTRLYGRSRIRIVSLLFMLCCFIFVYPIFSFFAVNNLSDKHAFLFIIGIIMLYPIHKLLHFIPLLAVAKRTAFTLKPRKYFAIDIMLNAPLRKRLFIIVLITPFLVVSTIMLIACILLPVYAHYFIILFSFHFGLCASDFIMLKNILQSPHRCFIEENEESFEILVEQP